MFFTDMGGFPDSSLKFFPDATRYVLAVFISEGGACLLKTGANLGGFAPVFVGVVVLVF